MDVTIYSLSDPTTKEIRYVGKTHSRKSRAQMSISQKARYLREMGEREQ